MVQSTAAIDARHRRGLRWHDMAADCLRGWERQNETGKGGEERPTWRGSARFVRWADDVGLDPLVLSCQEERTRKPQP
jgi:hypothetical protein